MNISESDGSSRQVLPDDLSDAPGSMMFPRTATSSMNTTTKPNTNSPTAGSYDQLLGTAQAAQTAADRAVADLALVKRTMAEAPRVLQLRRDELSRAQQALVAAEADLSVARDQVTTKQSEAARLIEVAADAQRALAQALITQDVMTSSELTEDLSARLSAANAQAKGTAPAARKFSQMPSAATLGANRYTPTPSMHPADLHAEVVEYLRERDALCPSCGHSLRGVQSAKCPGCKLQLSLSVLQSVQAHPMTATTSIWIVRLLSLFSFVMALYLTMVIFAGARPFGCGGGSDCHFIIRSPWSKVFSIPVAMFALPVHLAILISSLYLRVGLTDSVRRKGWTVLAISSLIAGLAGLWFIGVQAFALQALCPHCLLVNVAGIIGALIVLKKAPLGRPERLPEPAIGQIEVPKSSVWKLVIGAVAAVVLFSGIHGITTHSKPAATRGQILGLPDVPDKPESGLMMKGLESIKPVPPNAPEGDASKAATKDTATPATPATKAPQEPAGGSDLKTAPSETEEPSKGLLLPGLELTRPPKD